MTAHLVLASASPRRQQLLREAGFTFEVVRPGVTEREDIDLTVRELTSWNALRKGTWAARRFPSAIVLAADTLVSLEGDVLSKPKDHAEAVRFLRRLSGRTHQVCTAVFLCHLHRGKTILFTELSHVRFRRLTSRDIERYFAKVDPLDKAGAYAAQGHGREIIASVVGSFSNVVGLPMGATTAALAEFGLRSVPNESRPAPARDAISPRRGRASKSGTKTKR